MASVLELVKYYQHSLEKNSHDEPKILKCIDKLSHLDVTVQHLQETGIGRTVNALRKEPGDVGPAARALVYKWKAMVAAESSDNEGESNTENTHNGQRNDKDREPDNSQYTKNQSEHRESISTAPKTNQQVHRDMNGHHGGSKRKSHSSEVNIIDIL
uniref:TFIIS N-terminal domain-containing protein n=1 Tax=Bombyx mori TaxID=7091 RepID=A0A8R2HRY9_BOMMO|nr:transcription elongation factor B polypeptide 3-like [Bombyx mori]